jgi:DnaJ-class molecular chaperone
MDKRDPYEILGVDRAASEDEIKQAYRKLAREHHPDVNPNDPGAEERFKQISFAKDVLLEKERRKLYDEFGHEGLAAGFDPEQARAYHEWSRRARRSPSRDDFGFQTFGGGAEGVDLEDLLGQLFGRASMDAAGAAGPARSAGADLVSELEIDFLDAVNGNEVRLQLAGRDPIRVRIPPGAKNGQRIRLQGQGAAAGGEGKAGDLYIRLHVRTHPFFERDGDDLHLELPVTLSELMIGAEIDVPTPEGSVSMSIPAGSANGRRMRLRGKGVARGSSGERGDLYVRLAAVMPENATADVLEKIARDLEPLYEGQDPRSHLGGGTAR